MTVSKIAIVNPYLLRGLTESSEMEAIMRFIAAAKNLGIEAAVFKRSTDVYDFNPDFVIPISQQEPKLTPYPTYGLFNNPIQWAASTARFARNIFTYDGYFAVSPHAIQWLQNACAAINKKLYLAQAVFTVPQTEFTPRDLSNASAAYLGVNWDGLRHFALFQYFQDGTYVKCYGPKESWMKYPVQLYGGMIPFDGVTALNVYRTHGIGLGINHPVMDQEGVPTCRNFEIPASGAVGIFSRNAYAEQIFGDSLIYVNHLADTRELAAEIKEKINWIRSHAKEAQEMAYSAHAIFNRKVTLEHFIQKMVDMHHEVIAKNGFIKPEQESNRISLGSFKTTAAPKITYLTYVDQVDAIKPLIESIQKQTYGDIRLLLLFNKNKINESALHPYLNSSVSAMHYDGIQCNKEIFKFLMDSGTQWFGILKRGDKLFANHCSMLMNTYQNSSHDKNKENDVILFGNSLEHAESGELRDKLQDNCLLYLTEKTRVGNITPCAEIPLCATLFKLTVPFLTSFQASDFATNLRIDFATSSEPLDIVIHSNEITCSATVCDNPAILVIQNATSPLNYPSNLHQVQGTLLIDERQRQKMAMEQV